MSRAQGEIARASRFSLSRVHIVATRHGCLTRTVQDHSPGPPPPFLDPKDVTGHIHAGHILSGEHAGLAAAPKGVSDVCADLSYVWYQERQGLVC